MGRAGLAALASLLVVPTFMALPAAAAPTPLAANGQLHVCGTNLCNQANEPIQLRGMSTHGLQWFGSCYNNASLDALATDWNADLFRIAMYVQEGGYETNPTAFTNQVNSLVDMAEARGMYAMIDFHTLTPGDPNHNLARAKTFFAAVSARNANKTNVIYEIANEPNGVSWTSIKSYAEQVIPVIRANDPDAVIIVGTRGWSSLGVSDGSNANEIINNPVNATNIMYAFHFYAASHKDNYRAEVARASALLPLFVSEWGSVSATGGGAVDVASTTAWLDLLDSRKIGYANWTFSDANEGSAAFTPGTCSGGTFTGTSRLTQSGALVRSRIMTPDSWGTGGTDTTAPSTPTGLTSPSRTSASVTLSWSPSTDTGGSGLAGYDVYRGTTLVGSPTGTTFTATGLTPSTAYSFTVRARDVAGNVSSASSALSVTTSAGTTDTTAPSTPANLASPSRTSSSVTLTWTASTDTGGSGLAGYDVYRGTTLVASVTGTTATVSGLSASTAYSFTVRARDGAGNVSPASTALSVTTTATQTGGGGLSVQYRNADSSATDNAIRPVLRVTSTGTSATDLTTVTARYYFTRDGGASTYGTFCDWAAVGCSNVRLRVVNLSAPVAGADAYLEVSFAAGSLAAGGSTGDLQLRLHKSDWSAFNEVGDYSRTTGTGFADNTRITAYRAGTLAWGTAPA